MRSFSVYSKNERTLFSFILPVEMDQRRKQPTEIENFFAQTLIAAQEQMMIVIHTLTYESKRVAKLESLFRVRTLFLLPVMNGQSK
jgi:hypothetical protein